MCGEGGGNQFWDAIDRTADSVHLQWSCCRNILPAAAFGLGSTWMDCCSVVYLWGLKAPLIVWTVGAHCCQNQPIYREQFLQVVSPNDKMFLISFLDTACIPTKCEAFLDGIFQWTGEAELLKVLSWEWKSSVLLLQPLSVQDSTCY